MSKKVVPLNKGFMTLLRNYLCVMGFSFDVISVSLDSCITGLWHPVNRNYVFKKSGSCGDKNFHSCKKLNMLPHRKRKNSMKSKAVSTAQRKILYTSSTARKADCNTSGSQETHLMKDYADT